MVASRRRVASAPETVPSGAPEPCLLSSGVLRQASAAGDVELRGERDVAPAGLVASLEQVAGPRSAVVPLAAPQQRLRDLEAQKLGRVRGMRCADAVLEPLPGHHQGGLDLQLHHGVPERGHVAVLGQERDQALVRRAELLRLLHVAGPGRVGDGEVIPHPVHQPHVAPVKDIDRAPPFYCRRKGRGAEPVNGSVHLHSAAAAHAGFAPLSEGGTRQPRGMSRGCGAAGRRRLNQQGTKTR